MTAPPRAATALLKSLADWVPTWSVFTRAANGPCEFGGLSEETNGEGKSHRVVTVENVDSFLIRAVHVDGRAFVALWVHRPGIVLGPTKLRTRLLELAACDLNEAEAVLIGLVAARALWKPHGWKLDLAWRGKHLGEHAPKRLTATELKAYIAEGYSDLKAVA